MGQRRCFECGKRTHSKMKSCEVKNCPHTNRDLLEHGTEKELKILERLEGELEILRKEYYAQMRIYHRIKGRIQSRGYYHRVTKPKKLKERNERNVRRK